MEGRVEERRRRGWEVKRIEGEEKEEKMRRKGEDEIANLDISWSSTLGMATADLGSFLSMLS